MRYRNTVPSGGEYVLATYAGTLTGVFDNVSLPPNYAIDYGTGSNSQIKLVPEPAAITLLLAGSLIPMHLRRRR